MIHNNSDRICRSLGIRVGGGGGGCFCRHCSSPFFISSPYLLCLRSRSFLIGTETFTSYVLLRGKTINLVDALLYLLALPRWRSSDSKVLFCARAFIFSSRSFSLLSPLNMRSKNSPHCGSQLRVLGDIAGTLPGIILTSYLGCRRRLASRGGFVRKSLFGFFYEYKSSS